MSKLGTEAKPLRVAIIGSGPSGFYAADALLKSDNRVRLDMFERLPAPFGLVRYGVAPDHGKIKNVVRAYNRTAQHEDFAYFGNVMIGRDISMMELRNYYDAIILAVGCETDRKMGIPGEDLPGSRTATEFVAWYNGHPDYADAKFDLDAETVVVVGQGNVAVDVVRILGRSVDELLETDISSSALERLAESKVKDIYMIGRRGPAQAAFSDQEIQELGHLAKCGIVVDPAELELNEASKAELEDPHNHMKAKNYDVLSEYAKNPPTDVDRKIHIKFYRSPIELRGETTMESVVLERNQLEGEPGRQRPNGTGETRVLKCRSLYRSVGYHGLAMDGVPFDERRGIIPNEEGRVVDAGGDQQNGLYVVGWIKRGPSGLIGTNRADSVATVKKLQEDIDNLEPCAMRDSQAVLDLLTERDVRVVSFEDWQRLDAMELERGAKKNKLREKFLTTESMLEALDTTKA